MQKRVDLNKILNLLFTGGVSIREAARISGCTFKTAYLKYIWLGERSKAEVLSRNLKSSELYIDEQLTIEHTKLKPLSILLAVNENRHIVGVRVAKVKAFGHLADISLKKYGPRPNEVKEKMQDLLKQLASHLEGEVSVIKTDDKKDYRPAIKQHFPRAVHQVFKADEKKEKTREERYLNKNKHKRDPLFNVNHICAMLRDNLKRLTRRSWCTTKKPAHLELGLYMFMAKVNGYEILR